MHSTKIVLDPFCFKQFKSQNETGPIDYNKQEFTAKVDSFYSQEAIAKGLVRDGYAPFCKHLFIPNFTNTTPTACKITPQIEPLIKSAYEARMEYELPVLVRWVAKSELKSQHPAKYLDIILYSKEQIQKEDEAGGRVDPNFDIAYDYGIVSIKPQDVDHETPMQPITMMRNALGKEYGGSGIPLDEKKYKQSVVFWSEHILIK